MMNSNQQSSAQEQQLPDNQANKPTGHVGLSRLPHWLVILFLVVALLGFADATYLTVEHYRGIVPPCSLTGGCEQVLTSPYSLFAGIPVSLLGALYYFAVLVGTFAFLESKKEKVYLMKHTFRFTIFGLIASLWFIFVQVFILRSYCLYCLISAAISITLFFTASIALAKYKHVEE